MGFMDAVRTVFSKYFVIDGRAQRSEYWWFFLFALIGNIVLGMIDGALFGAQGIPVISTLFGLGILIPSITVGIRRLHDRDMTGWFMLLILIPLIGSIILLIIFVLKGTDGDNRFGPDPLSGGASSM